MVFDFGKFASDALRAVDRIRSLSGDPTLIDGNPTEPIESRINAFYRALGLPAIVSNASKFPGNNGNIHSIEMSEDLKFKFSQRQKAFTDPIPENIVKSFLDGRKKIQETGEDPNNLTIADGIKFLSNSSGANIPKRTRGSLFPLLVDGDIGIFPKENRIAVPFITSKDVIEDDIKYERPLLEAIILVRLRSEGAGNAQLQDSLNQEFQESLGEDFFADADINIFTISILRELLNSILNIRNIVRKTVQDLGVIRANIRTAYNSQVANVPDEQPIAQSIQSETGHIELLKKQQERELATANSLLALLEYDDTISSGVEITKNMKDAWMADTLLNLITTKSQNIDVSLKETQTRLKKLEQLNKTQQRQMDLLLGTFAGLSGVDIMVVILSLFLISQEVLLGLLNEDNFERLRIIKGNANLDQLADPLSAVEIVEEKITQIYDLLQQLVNTDKPFESNQLSRGASQ